MTTKESINKIFQPGKIGAIETRNRIVMLAMGTETGKDGYVTDNVVEYYKTRAKGGAGLIIVEMTCVDVPVAKSITNQLCIDDDQYIAGFRRVAAAIKTEGARAFIQLGHAGHGAPRAVTGMVAVAPSAVERKGYDSARELEVSEIQEIVERFADGAGRAKEAGFDGIELHGAHYYLIAQFLSGIWNERRDDYGGSLENRARFLVEIIKSIKEKVGPAFPVIVKMNAHEYGSDYFGWRGAVTLDESRQFTRMAQEAGADAIDVSCIGWGKYALVNIPDTSGTLVSLAGAIKEGLDIPVIAIGMLEPEIGEEVLSDGKADFIGIGRRLIADPNLPNKAASGSPEDIAPCIACYNCFRVTAFGYESQGVKCTVNAEVGREREYRITPTEKVKKVLIVGGGPAGMETARVAKQRGHDVMLYEKGNALGGQMILAAKPPGKAEKLEPLKDYLQTQLRKLEVPVFLNKEVTSKLVEELKPDAVVLACGIIPLKPEIPGIEGSNVVLAEDVLSGKSTVGDQAAIIGGGLIGCETAAFLAERGIKVSVVEQLKRMASILMPMVRRPLLERLTEMGVTLWTRINCDEITNKGIIFTDHKGINREIQANTIVIAAGGNPNRNLFVEIEERVPEVHLAGDCLEPRLIFEAIDDGAKIGRAL
ncbi:FAD-dependent oxidoreductase [Thermodesulfobacteriota bacterium]